MLSHAVAQAGPEPPRPPVPAPEVEALEAEVVLELELELAEPAPPEAAVPLESGARPVVTKAQAVAETAQIERKKEVRTDDTGPTLAPGPGPSTHCVNFSDVRLDPGCVAWEAALRTRVGCPGRCGERGP
jgi:hypothetical protein